MLSDSNSFLGDFAISDALDFARSKHQDLILLSSTTVPPVCKIGSLTDHVGHQNPSVLESPVAFDPGRRSKFVFVKIKEAKEDLDRKIRRAHHFLSLGRQTTVIIQRQSVSPAKTVEKIRSIAIELKDVGIANDIPNRTSDIGARPFVQLEFKPSKGKGVSLEDVGIKSIIYDDAPEEPKSKVREKELKLVWNRKYTQKKTLQSRIACVYEETQGENGVSEELMISDG